MENTIITEVKIQNIKIVFLYVGNKYDYHHQY